MQHCAKLVPRFCIPATLVRTRVLSVVDMNVVVDIVFSDWGIPYNIKFVWIEYLLRSVRSLYAGTILY